MPFPLHKATVGLLELMRLRTLGANPNLFSDQVQPVLETHEHYASDILRGLGAGSVAGAMANLTNDLTIDRRMAIKAVNATITIGAAAATNVTLEVGIIVANQAGVLEYVNLYRQFYSALAAGAGVSCGGPVPNWVLSPRTSGIRSRVNGTAAGVDHSLDVSALIEDYALP
jgi:hypothetical protein